MSGAAPGLVSKLTTVLFLLLVAACGGGNPNDDDAPDGRPPVGPRFYEDVAPILTENCVGCHRAGGVAPFPLVTYDDVQQVAAAIPDAVTTRLMPPWAADNSGDCNTFQDARWLEDAEIATLVDWVRGDRIEGDPGAAPPLPPPPPRLDRVDATAAMPEPYTMDRMLTDDYRCFVVDPGIATNGYLTGYEVRPGEPTMVHHMLLFQIDSAAAEANAADLDAQVSGPGYTCFGGPGVASTLIGVWAPGVSVMEYPAGTGLPVMGGRKMIVQIHYHAHALPMPDQTAVDLRIETTVPEPSFLFMVAAPNLNLPPGLSSVATTNQIQLPGFLPTYNVWGVFPHMHTLGRTLRVDVEHAGENSCFIDVERWDFNWQSGYFYDGPPKIAGGGDTVRITCTHDTSERDEPVSWGEGTEDEMCLAYIYVSPY